MFVIVLLILTSYYFFIRIPLHQLTLIHENIKFKQPINHHSVAEKILMRHLVFDEPTFISHVVDAAKHNNLTLKRITPSIPLQRNYYKIQVFSLALLGQYSYLINFISSLLKLPYIISLTHIEFAKSSQQQVNLQITMEVYHY